MRYHNLPAVGSLALPPLDWKPSPNKSSRGGRRARLVFVHVWGGGTYSGVVAWLRNNVVPLNRRASATLVYAGEKGADAGKCAQLVRVTDKAWTQCELNPVGLSVESADAIWHGSDPDGFARLARIVAALCHYELDACRFVNGHGIVAGAHGFTGHRFAGALGCGHPSCPTTDDELWQQFCERVVAEYRHGGFRKTWAR